MSFSALDSYVFCHAYLEKCRGDKRDQLFEYCMINIKIYIPYQEQQAIKSGELCWATKNTMAYTTCAAYIEAHGD